MNFVEKKNTNNARNSCQQTFSILARYDRLKELKYALSKFPIRITNPCKM